MGATLNGTARRSLRSRRGRLLLAQAVSILASYGGSLWLGGQLYSFLNSDGTTQAAESGSVGYSRDSSGTRHATQATTSRKPLLKYTAGRWGLKFDGTDDVLLTDALPTASAETFGVVYTAPATAASAQYPIGRRNATGSTGSTLYINNTNFTVNFINASGTVAVGAAIAAGATGVASAVGKVGSVVVRVNGTDGTPATYATYASGGNALALGNSVELARPFGGTIHAAYYAPVEISSADRQTLDRLLGKLFGVTVA